MSKDPSKAPTTGQKLPQREDEKGTYDPYSVTTKINLVCLGWCCFLYGTKVWEAIETLTEEDSDCQGGNLNPSFEAAHEPTLSTLRLIRPNVAAQILEYHIEWIEAFEQVPDSFGPWIYALMALLEKPLYPDVSSNLRTLARECQKQREKVIKSELELYKLNSLSLFICIVANYFGQSDMSD